MTVQTDDYTFTTVEGPSRPYYGMGGACYSPNPHDDCTYSGQFRISLNKTGLRVKPTVKWKTDGYPAGGIIMASFEKSPDGQQVSAKCGGHCAHCEVDGDLVLEQVTCVKKSKEKKYFSVCVIYNCCYVVMCVIWTVVYWLPRETWGILT